MDEFVLGIILKDVREEVGLLEMNVRNVFIVYLYFLIFCIYFKEYFFLLRKIMEKNDMRLFGY